ncbi:MAG TPA: hypothetical protein VJW20_07855 [Candidatus Angelobacter sp.]|nr:hypothetical protein [Candidatus Angelobacter sp.]
MKGRQHTNAFVVQFRDSASVRADQLPGRVEHVASGRTATFQSVEELPRILREMLKDAHSDEEDWIG